MSIIKIEKRVFDQILEKLELLSRKVEHLSQRCNDKKLNDWLDNHDVCEILSISPRTLQSLRASGKIAFTQVNHKVKYRPKDIERFIQSQKHI